MTARRGFTFVELLVAVAIIAMLVGLLLPAVQQVRQGASRVRCANNLKQLALASHSYHQDNLSFPSGVYQLSFSSAPIYRGNTLFVSLAPYMDQAAAINGWNMVDPLQNTAGGSAAPTATVIKLLICPSDYLPQNPTNDSQGWWYGLTSYCGNGGGVAYDPEFATNDGLFHVIGPGSQTDPSGHPITMAQVTDGLSNTALFGERNHFDPNNDSFATGFGTSLGLNFMGRMGGWASSTGRLIAGDVILSAAAPINYSIPDNYSNRFILVPPAGDAVSYQQNYFGLRVSAFGSQHAGGANFALCDGSVQFVRDSLPASQLLLFCVRNDGGAPTLE